MSFILEALKKSENERKRTIGPSLADVQRRPQSSEKPWWAIAIGALLIVNLIVLIVVLLRDRGAEPALSAAPTVANPAVSQTPSAAPPAPNSAPSGSAPVAAVPQARSPAPRTQTRPAVRSLAEEAAVDPIYDDAYDSSHLAAAATVPQGPSIVRPVEGPNVAPATMRPGASARPAEPAETLPTLRELIAGGSNLPDLRLDIHVHSSVPGERFVFVNMRKYIEGQTLNEGPTIERITADGVILNQQGLRFLLPRN
jgi:general secretion pathway protein B